MTCVLCSSGYVLGCLGVVVSAYYNEIDPFAAEWLRELIKAGMIAQGEVDERSIEDVIPADLRGFGRHHFSQVSASGPTLAPSRMA